MQLVNEVLQIIRGTEAAGGGKVAGDLIAPGGIQGVLHHGEQLHMGIAHLFHIGHQILGSIPVGEELPLPGAPPGAQVAFINIHGTAVRSVFRPVVQPALIAPGILLQIIDLGGIAWAGLGVERIGVSLGHHLAVGTVYRVLICIKTL